MSTTQQTWVYIQSEFSSRDGSDLFTVGFYSNGGWNPESDHATREEAAARANYLNGGDPAPFNETATERDRLKEELTLKQIYSNEISRRLNESNQQMDRLKEENEKLNDNWNMETELREQLQSLNAELVKALRECYEDSVQRCIALGLDPEKYSTTIKAKSLLQKAKDL